MERAVIAALFTESPVACDSPEGSNCRLACLQQSGNCGDNASSRT